MINFRKGNAGSNGHRFLEKRSIFAIIDPFMVDGGKKNLLAPTAIYNDEINKGLVVVNASEVFNLFKLKKIRSNETLGAPVFH